MRKLKRGATLLITTVALSVVTITSAAFSGIYFRYGKMNNTYYENDKEKMLLRSEINIAYEHFLKDTEVTILEQSKKLRTGWLLSEPGLEYQATLNVTLSNFIANFRNEAIDKSVFALYITGSSYTINSKIILSDGTYSLTYINYEGITN